MNPSKVTRKKCQIKIQQKWRCDKRKTHHHRSAWSWGGQKGAIKSGFNNFKFQQSQQHFYAWLILGIVIRNSKAKIKSSRDSLRLKFNAQKGRGEKWMLEQFSTTFFQFITFKGRCVDTARDAANRQNS